MSDYAMRWRALIVCAMLAPMLVASCAGGVHGGFVATETMVVRDLEIVETNWAAAIARNDVDAVSQYVTDDWIVVDANGHVIDRERFLNVIRSGALSHESMTVEERSVQVYQGIAVVTSRVRSHGAYLGAPFSTHERSSDVFVQIAGRWRCMHTHLTSISDEAGSQN